MNVPLRSAEWFAGRPELAFQHRSSLRSMGIDPSHYEGRPVIGIANSWSELNNCNMNLREVAEAVKRGVLAAGGLPLEFPTISLGEEMMKPSAMLYRNLMAMDVEETLRSNPIDGVVLLCNCDKTTPAQLMAAASANLPAIQLNGGPRDVGRWRGKPVGSGTDIWKHWDDVRAGRISRSEWDDLEACISCGAGSCNTMGTASTMTSLSEALGMMLPGTAAIPATDSRRISAAVETGRRIVSMVEEDLRPESILTPAAFDNAIRTLLALGGSTNAVVHLIAIAGRRNLDLPLARFDELSQSIPFLVNLSPSGEFLMDRFFAAGGVPAVLAELGDLLDEDCLSVTGQTLGENLVDAKCYDREVIRLRDEPISETGSLAVVTGNLAPHGAVIKTSAASAKLLEHRGRAVVFNHYQDMLDRIDDPELPVDADSVLVLKHAGPKGVPGFPEWGMIPVPKKLLEQGVTDIVRISDSRMSGTSYGTVVLHLSPEAAAGGTLALVEEGDWIELDVAARKLHLDVTDEELKLRHDVWQPPKTAHLRGYPRLYIDHVLQAHEGCDFDFLRPRSEEELQFVPPLVGRS
ncbi:MAG: dihydroxy-acid dehydratase [Planctomycetaceae bacterium]|nr:dihydroxy-acid dehydratase [Planctomycetaceae bacterium]MBT6157802.1 dihydroxy-acid dehydratase [Planctomycetaceae bacterium]MBT6487128.1 dihydroxy-acid dehydratase [Planctomycetaceae bacterium]MBT6496960.1 dihydroxy-acid dehydratase [Planctomycetaceae bacterium]